MTPDGEKALQMPADEFIRSAMDKYRDWKISRAKSSGPTHEIEEDTDEEKAVR